ncbi:restriction endonuclease subunit S [Mycoplasma sp. MV126]|uniref:restriction endonuclease subunit S n=1 Tax=Mycoplasma sp. MV126 TaxID=3401676 RepID=UPI003AAB126F
MQKEKLVPAIRFKGFDEEYITSKTIDILNIERGASPRPINNYLAKNGINWVKISDAPAGGYYITRTEGKIIPDGIKFSKQVFPGDLILSNSMSFGRPYIMGIPGCIHDGWLKISHRDNKFNSVYLCTLLGTEQMIKKYKSLAAGSTVTNLNKELVGSTQISYPAFEEQQKIGQFFSNLDILIHSQELKLEKFQTIKQSLLNKMFASFGQKMPQVRFKNFNEKWEVVLINELLEERNELSKKTDDFPLMAFISKKGIVDKGDKYDRESLVSDAKNKPYKKTFYGDFIYSSNNLESGSIGMNRYGNALISPVYNIFRAKRDSNYINYLLCRKEVINNMVVWRQGVIYGQWRIHPSNFLSIQIASSLSETEQQKIGQFFSNLDSLIHSQEQKLEKLNNIKQALLEKMFC